MQTRWFVEVAIVSGIVSGALISVGGCKKPKPKASDTAENQRDARPQAPLSGSWHAVLTSPGGPLPFRLTIREQGSTIAAAIVNGPSTTAVDAKFDSSVGTLTLTFPVYDATIIATRQPDGRLLGEWKKTTPKGFAKLPFEATRGSGPRFSPLAAGDGAADQATPSVDGRWSVTFSDDDGDFPAVGEFVQAQEQVTGTFLTETGDYRFLEGSFERGVLRLSTFDGAHAFLFRAAAKDGVLRGTFTSRDTYQARFVAERARPGSAILANPLEEVRVTSADRKVRFSFLDGSGNVVSSDDARFAGKVVVIDVFGTWCPNCNDEAPLLARLHRDYRSRGLEIVGLAFEFTGKPDRDREMVARFAAEHKIEYPLLLAGVSDKAKAAVVLPDVSSIKSYPTTIFVGRDGRVAKIHSGFSGPATGDHYLALVAEFEQTIEALLAKAPR